MVPDYGVASKARNQAVSFFSVCLFCEKSLCYFQYFNFTKCSNVTFQNFDVHEFVFISTILQDFQEFSRQKRLFHDSRMQF